MVGGWFDAYDAFLASEEYAKKAAELINTIRPNVAIPVP
jgi:hypothetical protein